MRVVSDETVERWQVPIRLAAVDMTSLLVSKPGGRGPATQEELETWERVHGALTNTMQLTLEDAGRVINDLAGEAVFAGVAITLTAYEFVREAQGPAAADQLLGLLRGTNDG